MDLPHHIATRMGAVRDALTDDLRSPQYRGQANPMAGHCYVASEALYHLIGGKDAGWKPCFVRHEGSPHWFLRHQETGMVADPTADQFESPPPYDQGVGKGFLTSQPSRRAQAVLDRMPQHLQKTATLIKMAISQLLPGRLLMQHPRTGAAQYDYSHLLTPQHRQAGYRMLVSQYAHEPRTDVQIQHGGQTVGWINGHRTPTAIKTEIVELDEPHQGRGLGQAMHEALYSHAYHRLGVRQVSCDHHSSMLSATQKKLAQKHGLAYKPVAAYGGRNDLYRDRDEWADTPDMPFDGKYRPFNYTLKGEVDAHDPSAKQAVAIIVTNPAGQFLMGQRRDSGRWCCPGGHVNGAEPLHHAAIREMHEETGMTPHQIGRLAGGNGGVDGRVPVHIFGAVARGTPTWNQDPDHEFQQFQWFSHFQDLPSDLQLHHPNDLTLRLLGIQPEVPLTAGTNPAIKREEE